MIGIGSIGRNKLKQRETERERERKTKKQDYENHRETLKKQNWRRHPRAITCQ